MTLKPQIRYLRDFVAIPSVNPMGRDDIPEEIAGETRYATHVREHLRRIGLDAELVGQGDRQSVIAEARVSGATDTVMVASHLDTVPVDNMEIDPFDPIVKDGRLFGRGSCDTKAGLACLLAALERVLERGTLRRNLMVVGEADEELTSIGVEDVLRGLGTRRPDWVLATEPTGLEIVTHHKGIAIARLEARGRACHSSDPTQGENAIVRMARAVVAIDALGRELRAKVDPILGTATCSIGKIGGGQAPNIVPDSAFMVMDRRLLPGESVNTVRAEIDAALERHGVEAVRLVDCHLGKAALGTDRDHPCVAACRRALENAGLPVALGIAAFGTDAGVLAAEGLPGVVMGPGSIDQAHTSREYVPVSEVDAMTEFYVELLESPGEEPAHPQNGGA